nr:hypothetical protein [Candidatus Sigynarchaeota archaeon]
MVDKSKLLSLFPGILGIAGLAAPAGFSVDVALWMFGLFASSHEVGFFDINDTRPVYVFSYIAGSVVFAVGIVLFFLAAFSKLKLGKASWLPGTMMLAGCGMFMIAGFELFMVWEGVYPVGICFSIVGSIWALVTEIKALQRAK